MKIAPRGTTEISRSYDFGTTNPVNTYVPGWKQNVVPVPYAFKTFWTFELGETETPEHVATGAVVVVVTGAAVVVVVALVVVVVAAGAVVVVVAFVVVVVGFTVVVVVEAAHVFVE